MSEHFRNVTAGAWGLGCTRQHGQLVLGGRYNIRMPRFNYNMLAFKKKPQKQEVALPEASHSDTLLAS